MTTQKIKQTVTKVVTVYKHTCDICGKEVDYLERCHICGRDMCENCIASISYDGWEGYMSDDSTGGYCKECALVGINCIRAMEANDEHNNNNQEVYKRPRNKSK